MQMLVESKAYWSNRCELTSQLLTFGNQTFCGVLRGMGLGIWQQGEWWPVKQKARFYKGRFHFGAYQCKEEGSMDGARRRRGLLHVCVKGSGSKACFEACPVKGANLRIGQILWARYGHGYVIFPAQQPEQLDSPCSALRCKTEMQRGSQLTLMSHSH